MVVSALTALRLIAEPQHGVFITPQALAAGVSVRVLARRVSVGEIERLHRSVYRFPGMASDWRGDAMMAVVIADPAVARVPDRSPRAGPRHSRRAPRAALSHTWAARAHGIERVEAIAEPELLVRGVSRPRRRDLVAHRTATLPGIDVVWFGELPVTSGARTVIDLAATRTDLDIIAVVDDVICGRHTTRDHLYRRALSLQPGRSGLESILRVTKPGAEGEFWSWLERRFSTGVVSAHDLPPPEYNAPIRDSGGFVGYADVLWRARLVVELAGLRFHRTADQQARDARKHNRYTLAGLRVLTFTYHDVVHRPAHVAAQIRAALAV